MSIRHTERGRLTRPRGLDPKWFYEDSSGPSDNLKVTLLTKVFAQDRHLSRTPQLIIDKHRRNLLNDAELRWERKTQMTGRQSAETWDERLKDKDNEGRKNVVRTERCQEAWSAECQPSLAIVWAGNGKDTDEKRESLWKWKMS